MNISSNKQLATDLYIINKQAKIIRDLRESLKNLLFEEGSLSDDEKNLLSNIFNYSHIDHNGEISVYYEYTSEYFCQVNQIEDNIKFWENQCDEEDCDEAKEQIEVLETAKETLEEAQDIIHNILKNDMIEYINAIYKVKQEVLNKLQLTPICFHEFDNGDIRPMFDLEGFAFHGESTELDSLENIEHISGTISSYNTLEFYNFEESFQRICNFLKN